MLPIFEIIMLVGGIYAIVYAKVPWYLGGGLKYQVEAKIVRWFGVLLILPLLVWLLIFFYYGPQRSFMVDVLTLVVMAILVAAESRLLGKQANSVHDIESTTSFRAVEPSAEIAVLQQILFLVMAVAFYLGIWVRLQDAGWLLIFFFIPDVILAVLHFMIQIRAIRRISEMKPSYVSLILLSNLFFFLGFVLQVDFGDQGGAHAAVVLFYSLYFKHLAWDQIPGDNVSIFMLTSIGFLVALIVSWFFLLGKSFMKRTVPERSYGKIAQ